MLYRLMVDEPSYELEYLMEEKNKNEPANLYIRGPYLMAETVNRNGRKYKKQEMVTEVARFTKEMIEPRRALGELNHPQSVDINARDSCHLITELKEDGNNYIGKSKVLSTPMGMIVRSLIMDNVKLGISSRALGKLDKKEGFNEVSGLRIITCDVVTDPSASKCYVDGILEAKQYIIGSDGVITESVELAYSQFENDIANLPKHETDEYLKNVFMTFIDSLKNATK